MEELSRPEQAGLLEATWCAYATPVPLPGESPYCITKGPDPSLGKAQYLRQVLLQALPHLHLRDGQQHLEARLQDAGAGRLGDGHALAQPQDLVPHARHLQQAHRQGCLGQSGLLTFGGTSNWVIGGSASSKGKIR